MGTGEFHLRPDPCNNAAPRLGFAHDLLGNAKVKLVGSWGWFYDAMKLEMANGSFGGFKWLSHYYLMDDTTLDWTKIGGLSGKGSYPGTFLETRNWRIPSFEDLDPDLKPMRMTETVAGIEYEAVPDYVVSFRYTRKNLDEAIEDVGHQTPAGEAYYITNPGRGLSVDKFLEAGLPATPTPKRTYNAFELRLRKSFRDNWRADVAYVYSGFAAYIPVWEALTRTAASARTLIAILISGSSTTTLRAS